MHKLIIFLALILSMDSSIYAKPPAWFVKFKEIEIFRTDRSRVESINQPSEIVGETKLPFKTAVVYKVSAGLLRADYSNGKCMENKASDWDVVQGVVISIEFEPDKPVKRSKLSVDFSGFDLVKSYDTPNFIYSNDRLGIKYDLMFDKKLISVRHYPNVELAQKLSCLKNSVIK